MLIVMIKSQHS